MKIDSFTGIFKKQIFAVFLACSILSGCSTYSNSFACGDAKGAACVSMDRVDRMIASGEIERFNELRKKCRGRKCRQLQQNEILREHRVNDSVQTHFTSRDKEQVQVE